MSPPLSHVLPSTATLSSPSLLSRMPLAYTRMSCFIQHESTLYFLCKCVLRCFWLTMAHTYNVNSYMAAAQLVAVCVSAKGHTSFQIMTVRLMHVLKTSSIVLWIRSSVAYKNYILSYPFRTAYFVKKCLHAYSSLIQKC